MEHLLSLEEISWKQKSRMLCIKEGDNNTKFFHKMANSHRRYNHLRTLEVDGVVFEEEPEVTNQVVQFYKNLYKESEGWRPFVEGLEFDRIGDMESVWLEQKFERKEILQVVSELEGDKALGPDGFTIAFYQHCWRVVEKDVLAVFEDVFRCLSGWISTNTRKYEIQYEEIRLKIGGGDRLRWFRHVLRRVINAPMRKSELIESSLLRIYSQPQSFETKS